MPLRKNFVQLACLIFTVVLVSGCGRPMFDNAPESGKSSDATIATSLGSSDQFPQVLDLQDHTHGVIWSNGNGIFGQRFLNHARDGLIIKFARDIVAGTMASAATFSDHSIVLAWISSSGLAKARYDRQFQIVGDVSTINATATTCKITRLSNDGYVIVYLDHGTVYAQIFSASDQFIGTFHFSVSGSHLSPSVTALSSGFIITVESGDAIHAAIYKDGSVTSFQYHQGKTVWNPVATELLDGSIVLAWAQQDSSSEWKIYSRKISSTGETVGKVISVGNATNSGTEIVSQQFESAMGPQLTVLSNGNYVIVWTTLNRNMNGNYVSNIVSQTYTAGGNPTEAAQTLNRSSITSKNQPGLTAIGNSRYVVSWEDNGVIYTQCQ